MKHINITNWQGNITDWTKFNYIYGGIGDNLADRVNLSIKGTNLRNYFRKSNNLIELTNVSSTTTNGITYSIQNGTITLNGTATANTLISLNRIMNISNSLVGTFSYNLFNESASFTQTVQFYIEYQSGSNRLYLINGSSITANKSGTVNLNWGNELTKYMYIVSGATFNNFVIKPMLVKGSTAPTTYEPYDSMVLVENVGTVDLGTLIWNYTAAGSLARFWTDNLQTIAKAPSAS